MRAAVFDRYGSVGTLSVQDRPEPEFRDVLVRVVASSVNPKDTFVRKGRFRWRTGRRFPQGTGYDFSGVVERSRAPSLPIGSEVFGMVAGFAGRAAAELVGCRRCEVALAPTSLPLADAAAVPLAGLTALQALRQHGHVTSGCAVLVNGASGGVGSFAIQIAAALGADVTAVAGTASLARCRDLGAMHVHDYRDGPLPADAEFDVVFDVFGNLSREQALGVLRPHGRHITTVPSLSNIATVVRTRFFDRRTCVVVVRPRTDDLIELAAMIDAGALAVPIAGRYPLSGIAAAHQHVETKHSQGKIIVLI